MKKPGSSKWQLWAIGAVLLVLFAGCYSSSSRSQRSYFPPSEPAYQVPQSPAGGEPVAIATVTLPSAAPILVDAGPDGFSILTPGSEFPRGEIAGVPVPTRPDSILPIAPGAGKSSFSLFDRRPKAPTIIPQPSYERPIPNPQFKQGPEMFSKSEELWIISRPALVASAKDDQYPGSGALMAKEKDREVPLPLKHTDVKAQVNGYIATVDVTQQFENPFDSKIEAVYVFPLPENSAVNEFVMVIGERQIRGIIRERGEAERIYSNARAQGYVASLLTQERPNIFTQSVANIEPGKRIDVSIRYYNTLAYMDGWFEFAFPMVVGPRFNPPGSTDGIGAVGRRSGGSSGQKTEVAYLKPGERSGHDIAVSVQLDAGVPIEEFESPTHKIVSERPGPDKLVATLCEADRVPNRDFVLRYRVTGAQIKGGLLTHKDERGGYFTMMLYPPAQIEALPRQPMEMVFVLDCSGSMSGRPLEQAKDAIRAGLKLLQPMDSFQLINFSITASQLGKQPLVASPENVRRGLAYLDSLDSEGGTMMIEGIKAALDFGHDPERLRYVCFLTDGYIGNEADIIKAIQDKLGPARIFSFGVGSSVNRYLLDSMAKVGRGAVAYFLPQTKTAPVMEQFFHRISHPALRDLRIDWAGMKVKDVYPRIVPDLYAGRPVILTGRFEGDLPGVVNIGARYGGGAVEFAALVLREDPSARPALASLWARARIADLSFSRNGGAQDEIQKTALDYSLLSQFTAFLAVDSSRKTAGTEGTTVPVAVPVPEGVKYSTTVKEN